MTTRHNKRWGNNEINQLHNEYEIKKLIIKEIAKIHKRTEYAILNKLAKEKLISPTWCDVRGWTYREDGDTEDEDDEEDEDPLDKDTDTDDSDDDTSDLNEDKELFDPYSIPQKMPYIISFFSILFSIMTSIYYHFECIKNA
jgi:hypothetical protein